MLNIIIYNSQKSNNTKSESDFNLEKDINEPIKPENRKRNT